MEETFCAPPKTLMKDGQWIVPESERPANWREITERVHPELTAVAVVEPAPVETEVVAVVTPTSVVASSGEHITDMGSITLEWAERKLAACKAEAEELQTTCAEAKAHKWKFSSIARAAGNALARVTFYQKVRDALANGYMLFPPVPNADCIAIRVPEGCRTVARKWHTQEDRWGSDRKGPTTVTPTGDQPSGTGDYRRATVSWRLFDKREKKDSAGNQITVRQWEALSLEDPEFPLLMAKPEIIQCVNAAMELKVFDEIRMFPFERQAVRKVDPCILGSIWDKRNDKRHYFLISWLVREQDI